MYNTGTWNSDLALFYLIVFLTPLWLKMIFWTISAFGANVKIVQVKKQIPVPVNVYRDRIVYRNNPSKTPKTTPKPTPKKEVKVARVVKPANKKPSPVVLKNTTDSSVMADAISGLKTLGVRKSDGKQLVEKLCMNKKYAAAEDLLQDCIAYIHKLRT